MMVWYNWIALSSSDDPSEDPCASPKLPLHVQWQPIEEEETGNSVDAEEECSAESGMCMHTILTPYNITAIKAGYSLCLQLLKHSIHF